MSGERAVLVPADSTDNGPFGKKGEKKRLRAPVWYPEEHLILELSRNKQTGTRDWEGCGSDCVWFSIFASRHLIYLVHWSFDWRVFSMKTFDQKDIVTDTLLLFFCHVFFTVRGKQWQWTMGWSCYKSRKQLLLMSLQNQRGAPETLNDTITSWSLLLRRVLEWNRKVVKIKEKKMLLIANPQL